MVYKSALSYASAPQSKVFSKLSIHLHCVVGTGTMVWLMMVEVPVYMVWTPRINNKCRPVILAPYITRNHEIYNGSGEVSCTFFLSHTDGWLDLAGVLLGTSELGDMHLPIWWDEWSYHLWWIVGDRRGLPRAELPLCRRPSWVHEYRGRNYKRVGVRGRGEGQWLAWVLYWAPHQGSVDEHATRMCNKDKISHG
jgi:hypothetical protein